MADLKISQLTGATTPLAGTEVVPLVQSGSTRKVSVNGLTTGKFVPANGMIFPATQVASADPNTLDDYEEGTWTPQLTFATAGDLAVTYGRNAGWYQKIGNTVYVSFTIFASAFTFTTASGALRITGLPFTVSNSTDNYVSVGCAFEGFTKVGYGWVTVETVPGAAYLTCSAYGSGVGVAGLTTTEVTSGSRKIIQAQLQYRV